MLPQERDYHRAVPRSSTALHETLGYELIGMLREVGRKFNRWIDTRWYQPYFEPYLGVGRRNRPSNHRLWDSLVRSSLVFRAPTRRPEYLCADQSLSSTTGSRLRG